VQKVFNLHYASAENVGRIIKDSLPDFAKYFVDTDSNQIVIMGNISLLQQMEELIKSLDRNGTNALRTETYLLRYADSAVIADNIRELFSAGGASTTTNRPGGAQGLQQLLARAGRGTRAGVSAAAGPAAAIGPGQRRGGGNQPGPTPRRMMPTRRRTSVSPPTASGTRSRCWRASVLDRLTGVGPAGGHPRVRRGSTG
jgi:type II secretory pathway component GspD/PulD (secretin)